MALLNNTWLDQYLTRVVTFGPSKDYWQWRKANHNFTSSWRSARDTSTKAMVTLRKLIGKMK